MVINCGVEVGRGGRTALWYTPVHGLGLAACPTAGSQPACRSPLPTSPLPLEGCRGNSSSMSCLESAWRPLAWDLPAPALRIWWHPGLLSPLPYLSCRRVSIITDEDSLPTGPQCCCPPAPWCHVPLCRGLSDTLPSSPLPLLSLLSLLGREVFQTTNVLNSLGTRGQAETCCHQVFL